MGSSSDSRFALRQVITMLPLVTRASPAAAVGRFKTPGRLSTETPVKTSHTPPNRHSLVFEEDILWQKEKPQMVHKYRASTVIIIALIVAIAAMVFIQQTTAAQTAPDRPDWQPISSVQNIYENHIAWGDYTDALDEEAIEDVDNAADYIGEALSVSIEYLVFMDGKFPKGSCAQDFWLMSDDIVQQYTNVYSGLYFNATALVGEPVEVEELLTTASATEGWHFENTPDKCWNKLDV